MNFQFKKFFFIGLGLGGPSSLSLEVLFILKSVDKVYFEIYTNFTSSSMEEYQNFLNLSLKPVYRNSLENESKSFLLQNKDSNCALLVSGDPFIATTHYMLLLEAVQLGLHVEVYYNISIYSLAPSLTGLSAYKFGKTVTIAFTDRIKSEASYDLIKENIKIDAHTLVLLDIDLEKKTFLSIDKGLRFLLDIDSKRSERIFSDDTMIIALNKLGSPSARIESKSIKELLIIPWDTYGAPQAFIIPSKLSIPEKEILETIWNAKSLFFHHPGQKAKIVVTGTFDILHPGHLEFFENAKKLAIPSELWVVVARISSVSDFKKKNPILDEHTRLKMLNSLKVVDHALLGNEGPDKIKIMETLQPDFIVLGYDQWIDEEKLKAELVKRGLSNTQVIRLPKYGSNGYSSSTEIRNKIISSHK